MAAKDTTAHALHYDKRKLPIAVYKFPIKYFFKWNKCHRFRVAIDPLTNELYILCNLGRKSKILIFNNNKLVRKIKSEFLTNPLEIYVSETAIFVHQKDGNYSIIKLSKDGSLLSQIRIDIFLNLCSSHGMLYGVNSKGMFVFDEDLNPLFNRKMDVQSHFLMFIMIRFNVVFICSNTLTRLEVYVYTLEGDFISHFWGPEDLFWESMVYLQMFICMDSAGSIISHESQLVGSRLSVMKREFGETTEKLGTDLLDNTKALFVDNQDRFVCITVRSLTYNIYIF